MTEVYIIIYVCVCAYVYISWPASAWYRVFAVAGRGQCPHGVAIRLGSAVEAVLLGTPQANIRRKLVATSLKG